MDVILIDFLFHECDFVSLRKGQNQLFEPIGDYWLKNFPSVLSNANQMKIEGINRVSSFLQFVFQDAVTGSVQFSSVQFSSVQIAPIQAFAVFN